MAQVEDLQENTDAISTPRNSRRSSSKTKESDFVISTSPKHVSKIVRAMLLGKSFTGIFKEPRYVHQLKDYRDIILVDEHDPLIPIICELQQRWRCAFPNSWPGFTKPKHVSSLEGHCFWVEPDEPHVFEAHYFRIANITFTENEVCFIIKKEGRKVPESVDSFFDMLNNLKDVIAQSSKIMFISAWQMMTWENIKNMLTFLAMCVFALGSVMLNASDWVLRLMQEISRLITAITPIVLKCLDIVQKVIGALFILFSQMWRNIFGGGGRRQEQRHYQPVQRGQAPQYLRY